MTELVDVFDIYKHGKLVVLKDHYCYVYSALLQMVHLILQERTFDCVCKRIHAKKYASVLVDIRKAITCYIGL